MTYNRLQFVMTGVSVIKPLPADKNLAPNVATGTRRDIPATFNPGRPQNPGAVNDSERARLIGMIQRNQSLTQIF
jgi:hypothetical protein